MFTQVSLSEFRDAFRSMDRENQFTFKGLRELFHFIERMEDDTGESIELDVIALCCDYTESTYDEAIQNYSIDVSEATDDDEKKQAVLDYLEYNTMIVYSDDEHVLYACF